jgi:CO/xanthine dehydrogenase Mo-binding subunit
MSSSIGVDVPRADGPAKIRGAAQYTADVELPGMLYVKALRSTYPHAKILRVDPNKAEKLPGVVAVLTRDDLKGRTPSGDRPGDTSLAQIVAEELGLAVDRVSVTFPDIDVTPFDQSTSSSRTVFTMGGASNPATGGLDLPTGKGKGSVFYFLSACAAEVEVHRHGKSNSATSHIRGGCGQSNQSPAMPYAKRGIDDHVVGIGAV